MKPSYQWLPARIILILRGGGLISEQPPTRPFRYPPIQLRIDAPMNANNIGVLHEQSVAHVLNRNHRVDGRAIKVNGGDT